MLNDPVCSVLAITDAKLKELAPTSKGVVRDSLVEPFNKILPEYQIETQARVAAFLAQMAHESAHFRTLVEYGNQQYFKRYDGETSVGKRLGNRPGFPDGFRYRGRGAIQITGLFNYKKYGDLLDIDLICNPDMAATGPVAARIAAMYWSDHSLNAPADKVPIDVEAITREINGGLNGLEDRENYTRRALTIDWIEDA